MSVNAETASAEPVRGPRAWWVLLALIVGLVGGIVATKSGDGIREPLIQVTSIVGELWLNALKMTVIPLIVALLITGIARTADAARGGRIATVSIAYFLVIFLASAVLGAFFTPVLTGIFPLPPNAADAMQAGLASIGTSAASAAVPSAEDFVRNVVPSNVIAAASNGDVLPLVLFTLVFALAVTRIRDQHRKTLVGFFEGISDALLVVIGWVLAIAPIGVLALAFGLGATAGGGAFAALGYYILLVSGIGVIVTLASYPVAVVAGGLKFGDFSRAVIAPQSVAISTRSSLASLPAMLASARILNIREEVVDVTLPMAVALFRATGPAMNLAVLFYIAEWMGLEPNLPHAIAAVFVAVLMSLSAVSLPGEISFVSSIAPIGIALGIPLAPLALLIAVEMVPDIIRTLGNVTMDVAVTAAVDRRTASRK
ncbi:dicarboxylate/amino acid:cation symporter [Sphingomonas alba]|uniref:Dicarboxylate/amino acid:cation symporter n=1 Tax=Sphingomonas alba TaxID=2908208 RepID=A0ABT0RKG7_9SPHN|nr:dicarboxylate/amino acid:cation symporter [Sphingomonas alba]